MPRGNVTGFTTEVWDQVVNPRIQDFQIAVAEQALKQAVARGFDNQPSVVTDNVANRDYHQVRPFGKIEFVARQTIQETARWLMAELRRRSPVLTGRYQKSHIFLINGAEATDADLDRLKPGDKVQIVNTQPYAGKIEGRDAFTRYDVKRSLHNRHGFTRRGVRLKKQGASRQSQQGESAQARNGVYRVVLQEAVQRYGRMVVVDYAPVQLSLGVRVFGQSGGRHTPRSKRQRVLRPQIYPCFTLKTRYLYS